MGCNSSKYVVNINIEGQGIDCQKVLKLLKLEENEINKLFCCFVKFDLSGDGKLSLIEFLTMLDIDETFLTKEIFNQMDSSGDKSLNFKEFVLSVWKYCVMSKKQIAEMVFELYDENGNGELNDTELKQMITAMYANKSVQYDMNKLLKTINHSRVGVVVKKDFIEASLKNQALLFPAFHMQKVLQEKICGVEFWSEQSIKSASVLSNPEVQELFKKRKFSLSKHISVVTPINTPQKNQNDETLVIVDITSTKVSEKKKPIKHTLSHGPGDSFKIHHSPSNVALHSPASISQQFPELASSPPTKSNRSVASKQHSLDDHIRSHHNRSESNPAQSENKSTKHNRSSVLHKQHTTGHDSPIIFEDHQHSSKGDNRNGDKWVAASRSRHGKK